MNKLKTIEGENLKNFRTTRLNSNDSYTKKVYMPKSIFSRDFYNV